MAPPSFTVDGVRYTWPRLPLYDYGPENRRQMDAICAGIICAIVMVLATIGVITT